MNIETPNQQIPDSTTIAGKRLIKFERILIPKASDAWVIIPDPIGKDTIKLHIVFEEDPGKTGSFIFLRDKGSHGELSFVNWKPGMNGGLDSPLAAGNMNNGEEFFILAWCLATGDSRKIDLQVMGGGL